MEQWLSEFRCRVVDASAGRTEFPVVFALDRVVSPEEVGDAFRVAREVDRQIAVVKHEVDYAQLPHRSVLTVRPGMLDPNPPPFLELDPMPLIET